MSKSNLRLSTMDAAACDPAVLEMAPTWIYSIPATMTVSTSKMVCKQSMKVSTNQGLASHSWPQAREPNCGAFPMCKRC